MSWKVLDYPLSDKSASTQLLPQYNSENIETKFLSKDSISQREVICVFNHITTFIFSKLNWSLTQKVLSQISPVVVKDGFVKRPYDARSSIGDWLDWKFQSPPDLEFWTKFVNC